MINKNRPTYKQSHCGYIGLITGLILFCVQAVALASETADKILINADHMHLNIKTGNSEYTGNVRISQGKLVLSGDKVTLEQKNNEVERITVIGKPARYNHVTDQGEAIEAESNQMVYNAGRNKLTMTGNARLQQPDHQVSSQKIVYDTLNKIIIAGGADGASKGSTSTPGTTESATGKGSQKQRVNITLTPKKQPQNSEDAAAE
jgi:lipopolysaccharide export system protein LptA